MSELRLTLVVAGSRPGGPLPDLLATLRPYLLQGEAELVVVTAAARPPSLYGEPNARVIRMEPGTTVPLLRAEGARAARAPWVALTEDFCVPEATWCPALLSALEASHAPVVGGPVLRRAGTRSDWARTFVEYGRFLAGPADGFVEDLSGCNVAYERGVLEWALGSSPTDLQEVFVHARLRASGIRFWKASAAIMFDESRASLRSTLNSMYHHGRLYAGERVAGASWLVRGGRALAAPLVPAVHALRIARGAARARLLGRLLACLGPLVVIEVCWAWGELVGSLRGAGSSRAEWT